VLCCDPDRAADLISRGFAVVLARQETSPADIHGMIGAAGLITTLGGVASHAAVVARSWAIPAVTSVENTTVRATGIETDSGFVAEGELVTVDGNSGAVYLGNQRTGDADEHADVAIIRSWATELGVEPGLVTIASDGTQRSTDVTLFELARVIQLKGLCTVERAAVALAAAACHIEQLIAASDALFQMTPRGIMLTPNGRSWVSQKLHEERDAHNIAEIERSYARFVDLNQRFKQIVSAWQMASRGETDRIGWDVLVESVSHVQSHLQPILERHAALVPRLGAYTRRFAVALDAMRAGDRSMLASPLKDSYHTVWFEYHEELMTLCGRGRASEERQAP
jgi:pyruvate,orthophosphate dikinase